MTTPVHEPDPWSWARSGAVAVMLGLVIGCGRGRTLSFSQPALATWQSRSNRIALGDRLSDSKGGQSTSVVDAETQHVAEGPQPDQLPGAVGLERPTRGSAAAAADHGTKSLAPSEEPGSAQAAYMKELLEALQATRVQRDAAEKVVESERRSSAETLRKIREEAESRREILSKEIVARGAEVELKAAALSAAKLDAARSQTEAKELKSAVDALRTVVAACNQEIEAAKDAAEERETKAAAELSEARAEVSALRAALEAEQKKEGAVAAALKRDAAKEKSDLLDQVASVRRELKLDAAKSQTEARELKSEVDGLRTVVAARNQEMEAAKDAADEREAKAAGELSKARAEISALRTALEAEQKKEGEIAAVLKSDAAKEKSDLLDQLASVRRELQAAQSESTDRARVARESAPAPAERAASPSSSGGPGERGAELGNVSRDLSGALATRDRLLREIQKAGKRAESSGKGVVVYPNAAEGETARLSKTLADTEGLITQLTARLAALQQ